MAEVGESASTEPIRFRSGKKRKAYRQRAIEDIENDDASSAAQGSDQSLRDGHLVAGVEEDTEGGNGKPDDEQRREEENGNQGKEEKEKEKESVISALKLRNSRRGGRLRGVGFKSESQIVENAEQALVKVDGVDGSNDSENTIAGMDGRFMHQTGLLTILDDKHMNEFIEARLASRKAGGAPNSSKFSKGGGDDDDDDDNDDDDDDDHNNHKAANKGPTHQSLSRTKDHQPARQGKLFEVSIPEDVRKMDDTKRRRVEKTEKPPRRAGNRRNSDDVERDNLVEQFLHENRLDVYDTPEESTSRYAPGRDYSSDARLADQFRRQYYEDLALRRKKRRPAQSKPQHQQYSQQSSSAPSEVLKGPKLGGSRNQRAAIRNILLQQQETKKEK